MRTAEKKREAAKAKENTPATPTEAVLAEAAASEAPAESREDGGGITAGAVNTVTRPEKHQPDHQGSAHPEQEVCFESSGFLLSQANDRRASRPKNPHAILTSTVATLLWKATIASFIMKKNN